MSRKSRQNRADGLNSHHIYPSSRGGGGRHNLVLLPMEWHACWHKLFVNMTVDEVHIFIEEVMTPNTEWTYKALDQLRRRIMRER